MFILLQYYILMLKSLDIVIILIIKKVLAKDLNPNKDNC